MKQTLETIVLVFSVVSGVGAFVILIVGKFLNLRDKITKLETKDQFTDKDISDMKEDIKQLQDQWNKTGRNN